MEKPSGVLNARYISNLSDVVTYRDLWLGDHALVTTF